MRFATWNVESVRRLSPEREAALHGAMAGVDADVWVLTETWPTFSPGTGYRRAAVSEGAEDLRGWTGRCWVAVWVKESVPVTSVPVRAQPDRTACCRIGTPGGGATVVIGVVLPWASDRLWPGADGFCAALAAQTGGWRAVRGGPGESTVVAGDFNQSTPYARWYGSRRGEAALRRALRRLRLSCLTRGVCGLTGVPRVDHVCVGREGLAPRSLTRIGGWAVPTVGGRPATDHSGVYVDLDGTCSG